MRWPASTTAAVDAAAAAARSGDPVVLAIEGRSGFGKSTLLRAAATRLDGFRVLRAFGEHSAQDERFQLLTAWDAAETPRHTMHAIQLLTRVVDQQQLTGPVALLLDDLQWIDPESVSAVAAVVERAAGDRLLVLAAHRPLGARHPAWQGLEARTIHLDGLDVEAAAALLAVTSPAAPAELAEALRHHTGGSPLYMRALLREHPWHELTALAARGELPAPAGLAAAVDARLADLAPNAALLLHTLAILDDRWTDLPTAAAVGAVDDVDAAVGVLLDEGLVQVDRTPAVPLVRMTHAVLRAAAYETVPAARRRRLHHAAAARLPEAGDRLRHRLAASSGADEGLAGDIDRHADGLHDRGRYREAARFRRLAAGASTTPASWERRILDADIESIVARDLHEVTVSDLDEQASAHRRFVYGLRLSATRQWVRAAEVFDDLDPDDLDAVNAYRARVLRGWTIIGAGRAPASALPPLEEAHAAVRKDPTFHTLFVQTYGQARQAAADHEHPAASLVQARRVDRVTLAATPEGLARLTWRGAVSAVSGSTARAIDDLTVVTQHIDDGTLDTDDGVSLSFLGYAQWCSGDWRRAAISIDLASTAAHEMPPHPLVLATAPLAALVNGEDPRPGLRASRTARLAGPAPATAYLGDVVEIVALAFVGTTRERRSWRARRTADFGVPSTLAAARPPLLWLLATGLGAAWAGDADATDSCADALAGRGGPDWCAGAVRWLQSLAELLRGRPTALVAVARDGLPGLRSFHGLLWADAARQAGGVESRTRAEATLTGLGAGRYVPALLPDVKAPQDPLAPLSDRERDIAALVLEGLSYAQIAKELHVTRSTVAFHLSNVYAKTDTSSRHQFVQLARSIRS